MSREGQPTREPPVPRRPGRPPAGAANQRRRLIEGVIAAAADLGYPAATVAQTIERAGVSRTTFYELFADRDACFLAALAHIHERLLDLTRSHIAQGPPERALVSAVEALFSFHESEPASARVLTLEPLSAGTLALDARDRVLQAAAALVESAYARLPPETPVPDIAPVVILGGIERLLASRLRRGEPGHDAALLADLSAWVESYRVELREHRWRALTPDPALPPGDSPAPLRMPLVPPRGRLEREELLEIHRQRILYATAESVLLNGYRDTTIGDITTAAALDARAFYRLLSGKEAAFMAVLELYFQHVMSVTAGAFFSPGDWPQRIWVSACAFTGCMDQHHTLAHVSFIESYTAGPATVQRVEELVSAFTLFLQEGYEHASPALQPPSAPALHAIAASNFEIVYRQTRRRLPSSSLRGHFVQLALAPFLGPTATAALIGGHLRQGEGAPGR